MLNYIEKIYFSGNNLQATGTSNIAKACQHISTFEVLKFSCNSVGIKAAENLALILLCSTELKELYLAESNLQTKGAAFNLLRAINHISSLTVFSISNNNIGAEVADDIANTLSYNTRLRELYLDSNHLQASGIIQIAKSLEKSSTLKILNIASNNIKFMMRLPMLLPEILSLFKIDL